MTAEVRKVRRHPSRDCAELAIIADPTATNAFQSHDDFPIRHASNHPAQAQPNQCRPCAPLAGSATDTAC